MDRSKSKMAKYNFKVQLKDKIFGVDNCDSFDEAIGKVQKGIYDYKLAYPDEFKENSDWTPAERLDRTRDEMRQSIDVPSTTLSEIPNTKNLV